MRSLAIGMMPLSSEVPGWAWPVLEALARERRDRPGRDGGWALCVWRTVGAVADVSSDALLRTPWALPASLSGARARACGSGAVAGSKTATHSRRPRVTRRAPASATGGWAALILATSLSVALQTPAPGERSRAPQRC